MWAHIVWPENEPDEHAKFECPHCKETIEERVQASDGDGRPMADHEAGGQESCGLQLNALVSLVPNANGRNWPGSSLRARTIRRKLQAFTNTLLAEGWTSPSMVDEGALAARAEEWELDHMPKEVLVLTAGGDVQDDRVEITVCGWTRDGDCLILGHMIIWAASPINHMG